MKIADMNKEQLKAHYIDWMTYCKNKGDTAKAAKYNALILELANPKKEVKVEKKVEVKVEKKVEVKVEKKVEAKKAPKVFPKTPSKKK